MDLVFITVGVFTTTGFGNPFFVLYYPALLTMGIVFPSRSFSFGVVILVATTYAYLSFVTEPGVSFDARQDKVLIIRTVTMFAVVGAASLMHRLERNRSREAVEAERLQAQRNLELQRKAQAAELTAQEERSRIAREIHDGISQSVYALSLSLETCADLAERDQSPLKEQLQRLVPLAKKALLETRYYIHDLKPLLEDERDLVTVADSQVPSTGVERRLTALKREMGMG